MNACCSVCCQLGSLSALLALVAPVVIVTSGLGYRAGWWHFLSGLRMAEWVGHASAVALVPGLAGAWTPEVPARGAA
jgi:hypothetical protein